MKIISDFLLCSYTGSLGNDDLKLQFVDGTGSAVAVHAELYNLDRGLSLCRYRVHRQADGITVSIKLHGEHLKSSPFNLGAIQPEHCPCPRHSVEQWLAAYQCPLTQEQVDKDLDQFRPTGIQLKDLYKIVSERFPRTSFVHYSIIKNKVSFIVLYLALSFYQISREKVYCYNASLCG